MLNKKRASQKRISSSRPEASELESDTVGPTTAVIKQGLQARDFISSLYHRDYRYFWFGALFSNIGTWLQIVALGWLVLKLTNSAFYLGLVSFATLAPVFFFAIPAGLAADMYDRRRLIIATQAIMMFFALLLGVLTSLEVIAVFSIVVIVLTSGIALAFNFPAWQAIVPDLVPKDDLLNGIALNSAQFNAARLVGPAFAGLILAAWGVASCFYANGWSFLTVIIALSLIQPKPNPQVKKGANETIWQYSLSGVRYAKNHVQVAVLLLSVGLVSVLGTPYTTLMPIYAQDILKVGPQGYGFLLATSGLGAVVGGFLVGPLSRLANKQVLIKSGVLMLSISLLIFAFSKSFVLSLIALAVIGGALLAAVSTINTSLQLTVPNEIRGRIMSLYVLMFLGMMPFGSLIFGSLAEALTSPLSITIGAVGCMLWGLILVGYPSLLEGVDR